MNLERINIWAEDVENSRKFYTRFFAGKVKRKSRNKLNESDEYSITFGNGPALAVKRKNEIADLPKNTPIIHPQSQIAFRFENRTQVDDLTDWIGDEGYTVESEPTQRGNGLYRSIVVDPDKNKVEIYHES